MRVNRDVCGISIVARRTISLTLLVAIALIHPSRGVADEFPGVVSEKQTLPPLKSSERYHIGFVFCIPPSSLVGTFGIAASRDRCSLPIRACAEFAHAQSR